jgi:hypothetical protein
VAPALAAWVSDDLARAAASAAGAADREKALLIKDFTPAVAGGAGGWPAARLGTGPFAPLAGFHARNLDFGRQAENGLLERDFQVVTDVFPTLSPVAAPAAPSSTEKIAEAKQIAQDVAEIGERLRIESSRTGSALQPRVPEPVVGGALLAVAEDAICLGSFLEFLFRRDGISAPASGTHS